MAERMIVLYDVRNIQKYIFRTAKMKDAIGASGIIDGLVEKILEESIDELEASSGRVITRDLEWFDGNGPKEYREDEYDVQTLYIGGGNAYVTYSNHGLALKINRLMSRKTIELTYSLQLAIAMVPKTGDYPSDFEKLMQTMTENKAKMIQSCPVGAFPVMETEIKTGYPVSVRSITRDESTESLLKKRAGETLRRSVSEDEKRLESLITEKGVDSTVAVVHLDGNNMALRIRELIKDKKTYADAVSAMRRISYNIQFSFQQAFESTYHFFQTHQFVDPRFRNKVKPYYIAKVVTAGDDITYVCNGPIAMATVEYFVKQISRYTLKSGLLETSLSRGTKEQAEEAAIGAEEAAKEERLKYGFSVCAGIAYVGSHFPFNIAYDVAEECCGSAKKRAKMPENLDQGRIGNWMDFAICQNVQARSFSAMRKKEYVTASGENLLLRPLFIPDGKEAEPGSVFDHLAGSSISYLTFRKDMAFFSDKDKMPRSWAKTIRNTYPLGLRQVSQLMAFLDSRGRQLPDGRADAGTAYVQDGKGRKTARYYDVLEFLDMFVDDGGDDICEESN